MNRVSLLSVLVGGVADVAAINILAIPLIVVAMTNVDIRLPQEQLTSAVMAALGANPTLFAVAFYLGVCGSVLGGYVAASIAGRGEVLNGALSAYLCVGIGVYGLWTSPSQLPLWIHIVLLVLSPALGGLGGFLRQQRMARSDGQTHTGVQTEVNAM